MNKIKTKYKIILLIIIFFAILIIEFPYYVESPGGISSLNKKINIEGYKSEGSFNLAYVSEYPATIPMFIYSFFNKNYDIVKMDDVMLEGEDSDTYLKRDKLFMDESISNAIGLAYKKAGKDISVIDSKIYVLYVENKDSDLAVGDEIISLNGSKVNTKKDIENILNDLNIGDKVIIKVKNGDKKYNRYSYLSDEKKIGIIISNVNEYKTDPEISIKVNENESGPSGGLMIALSIYNSLVRDDITNGEKIVGTGTIDVDGNVGEIGGVKYKLISAVKSHANLFLVPDGDNCSEAKKIKKEYKYDIAIKCVKTFDETIDFLKSRIL